MPTGDLDSRNLTAAPFLVDEAAAAPWLVITVVTGANVVGWVIVLAGTVVAGIVLIGVVFPEITVSIVEAAIVSAGITVGVIVVPGIVVVYTTTDASSVIGMALPTPVPVHWGGMESVAVLGLADSSFE